jgi:Domain of unknown function (DUF6438)
LTDEDFADAIIILQRTMCFGSCPDYALLIHGSGEVSYMGNEFVKVTGEQHAQIDPEAVRELVKAFYQINFFAMQDLYTYDITDLPFTYTSIFVGNDHKQVCDYACAPPKLWDLEELIDKVANSAQWVKAIDN